MRQKRENEEKEIFLKKIMFITSFEKEFIGYLILFLFFFFSICGSHVDSFKGEFYLL